MQIIFQDPFSSLNPRMRAGDIVGEPLQGARHLVAQGAARAGGGAVPARSACARRRWTTSRTSSPAASASASASPAPWRSSPKLIIGDEPVSALDVSIQAQVINLLTDLQKELKLSYLFISHNLAVVEHISHRIAVMYLGRIVEYTDKTTLFTRPLHPYTEALLAAVPVPDPAIKRAKRVVQGDVPSPMKPPPGCHFHPRCPYAVARCKTEPPVLREVEPGHQVACHLR